MAEYISGGFSSSNPYFLYRIVVNETGTNTVNNTSTVNIKVQAYHSMSGTTINYSGSCYVKIDGVSQTSTSWSEGDKPVAFNNYVELFNKDITISHNDDGAKTIQVAACFELYSEGNTKISSSFQSFDVALTALDRNKPTVTVSTSNISSSGLTLAVSTTAPCDKWEYSINGGISWTQFSTTSSSSQSTTISSLMANTLYQIKARARKATNQVNGVSSVSYIRTLAQS